MTYEELIERKTKAEGFTLVEVLLGIVVLGVIAALVIPSMISKKDRREWLTALNKSYTILSEGYKQSLSLNNGVRYWNESNFIKNFMSGFRVQSECTDNDCVPEETYLNDEEDFTVASGAKSYVLADGQIATVNIYDTECNSEVGKLGTVCGEVFMDVNGVAGPNKWGKDYFGFYVTKDKIVPFGSQLIDSVKEGFTWVSMGCNDGVTECTLRYPCGDAQTDQTACETCDGTWVGAYYSPVYAFHETTYKVDTYVPVTYATLYKVATYTPVTYAPVYTLSTYIPTTYAPVYKISTYQPTTYATLYKINTYTPNSYAAVYRQHYHAATCTDNRHHNFYHCHDYRYHAEFWHCHDYRYHAAYCYYTCSYYSAYSCAAYYCASYHGAWGYCAYNVHHGAWGYCAYNVHHNFWHCHATKDAYHSYSISSYKVDTYRPVYAVNTYVPTAYKTIYAVNTYTPTAYKPIYAIDTYTPTAYQTIYAINTYKPTAYAPVYTLSTYVPTSYKPIYSIDTYMPTSYKPVYKVDVPAFYSISTYRYHNTRCDGTIPAYKCLTYKFVNQWDCWYEDGDPVVDECNDKANVSKGSCEAKEVDALKDCNMDGKGTSCAAWAIVGGNMIYLDGKEISW